MLIILFICFFKFRFFYAKTFYDAVKMRVYKTNSESRPRHVSTIARHGGMTKTCSFMNHSNFLFILVLLKSSISNLVKHAVF